MQVTRVTVGMKGRLKSKTPGSTSLLISLTPSQGLIKREVDPGVLLFKRTFPTRTTRTLRLAPCTETYKEEVPQE